MKSSELETVFHVGDIVTIADDFASGISYETEYGERIRVPHKMFAEMHGKTVTITGIHYGFNNHVSYYTSDDPMEANMGFGWRWPACLLTPAAKHVEIRDNDLFNILV